MPKLPTKLDAARATMRALGDEAHYEGRYRHPDTCDEALAVLRTFDTVGEKMALRLQWLDGFDLAQQRQIIAQSLGVPQECAA